jgi:hypothetical protein
VTDKDHDQTSDEVTGESTSAFPSADFLNEPNAPPTVGADSAVSEVEALPPGSALIVVKRGPRDVGEPRPGRHVGKRRIPVPAGSAGDVGGPTSWQRHFS